MAWCESWSLNNSTGPGLFSRDIRITVTDTQAALQLSLASASPRRRELLDQIGIHYRLLKVSVDESLGADESPLNFVERLARAKARAGHAAQSDLPVLGADTCVVADQHILGKPTSAEHAVELLQQLSRKEPTNFLRDFLASLKPVRLAYVGLHLHPVG